MRRYIKSNPWFPPLLTLAVAVFLGLIWAMQIEETVCVEREIANAQYESLRLEIEELRMKMEVLQTSETSISPPSTLEILFVTDVEIPLSPELQSHTYEIAEGYGVLPEILFAIMEHESGYQVNALGRNSNGTTDHGLMQINTVNHLWLLEDHGLDVTNPLDNIEAGAVILSTYLKDYNMEEALAAYAVGESAMLEGDGAWFAKEILEMLG